MPRIKMWMALGLGLAAAACGANRTEEFHPGEHATAESLEGRAAAEYTLESAGSTDGEVKIWSEGAYRRHVGTEKRTVVHVALQIENEGYAPLEVRDLSLDSAVTDDGGVAATPPTEITGATVVQPGATRTIEAEFPMPKGVSPQEVDAFVLDWSVMGGSLDRRERTSFVQDPDEPDYYYYYGPGYYYPYHCVGPSYCGYPFY
jgi:hypothetical protein